MTPLESEIRKLITVITLQEYKKTPKGDGASRMFLQRLVCGSVPVTDLAAMGANLINKARAYFFHHSLLLTVVKENGMCRLAMRQIKEKK